MTFSIKTKFPLWILVLFIAFLLVFISLFSFKASFLLKPEESVINLSTKLKKNLRSDYDTGFFQKNFVLVNTAYNVSVIKKPFWTDSLTSVITDRKKLALLFKWLLENKEKFSVIACDLRFESADLLKENDDSLNTYIYQLIKEKKILFAGTFDKRKHEFDASYFKAIHSTPLPGKPDHIGNTDYESGEKRSFMEYTLINEDGAKSFPLVLYERVNDCKVVNVKWGLFNLCGNKTGKVWNTFVPEILFNNKDFSNIPSFEASGGTDPDAAMVMLSSVATQSETNPLNVLLDPAKQKVVFIGTFGEDHNDKHHTLYGQTDGSVILLNIYYNIVNGENNLNWWFMFFLFGVYLLLSVNIVFNNSLANWFYYIVDIMCLLIIPRLLLKGLSMVFPGFKIAAADFKKWIQKESQYLFLVLVALASNFLFNKVINIVVVFTVVVVLFKIFKNLYNKKSKTI